MKWFDSKSDSPEYASLILVWDEDVKIERIFSWMNNKEFWKISNEHTGNILSRWCYIGKPGNWVSSDFYKNIPYSQQRLIERIKSLPLGHAIDDSYRQDMDNLIKELLKDKDNQ